MWQAAVNGLGGVAYGKKMEESRTERNDRK
jgi:hypothetical protein